MKIVFKRDYAYSFDGVNVTIFKNSQIFDADDNFAKLMLDNGYAEQSIVKPETEEKNVDIDNLDNKIADIKEKKKVKEKEYIPNKQPPQRRKRLGKTR